MDINGLSSIQQNFTQAAGNDSSVQYQTTLNNKLVQTSERIQNTCSAMSLSELEGNLSSSATLRNTVDFFQDATNSVLRELGFEPRSLGDRQIDQTPGQSLQDIDQQFDFHGLSVSY